jgi:predicted nucleic acid-binding protein
VILVDSSVWIAHLRGSPTPATQRLSAFSALRQLLVGDLVLLEMLQGARSEAHAKLIERGLLQYPIVPLLDSDLAARAARNYRRLREKGITIRKINDVIIGTYCIEHGHALLHDDRDFAPMQAHLGLKVA